MIFCKIDKFGTSEVRYGVNSLMKNVLSVSVT